MMFRDLFFKLDYVWDFQFDWASMLEEVPLHTYFFKTGKIK